MTRTISGIASAMRNPFVFLSTLLIILFFPLNLLDYVIWAIVNLGVVIINSIIWILVLLINGIISLINSLFDLIETGLESPPLNLDVGDIPNLNKLSYNVLEWIDIDIFSPSVCLFTIILQLLDISFPIW